MQITHHTKRKYRQQCKVGVFGRPDFIQEAFEGVPIHLPSSEFGHILLEDYLAWYLKLCMT